MRRGASCSLCPDCDELGGQAGLCEDDVPVGGVRAILAAEDLWSEPTKEELVLPILALHDLRCFVRI